MKPARWLWLGAALLACACGDAGVPGAASSAGTGEPPPTPDPLVAEAGFVDIAPYAYAIHHLGERAQRSTGHARLFWSFQPADESPEARPLLVIFNGGPGAASGILLGLSTAPSTLDPQRTGGAAVAPNPASWTRFANLLYVDARNTGFSYLTTSDPGDAAERGAALGTSSFNPFVDGADLVRVILRFLAARAPLRAASVVLVGESYGGIRASVALHMLLQHPRYADGSAGYEDPALVDEVRAHLDAVLGPGPHTPAAVASQFGAQALLQPRLSSVDQNEVAGALLEAADSPLWTVADETGVPFVPCAEIGPSCEPYAHALDFVSAAGRDYYDLRQPRGWTLARYAELTPAFQDAGVLEVALGVAPAAIEGLPAGQRQGSFRLLEAVAEPEPLAATLGALGAADRYHRVELFDLLGAPFVSAEAQALGIDRRHARWGALFLENLREVRTLVSDAPNDVVIFSAALPEALSRYEEIVDSVAPAPGGLSVQYLDGSQRAVVTPRYSSSGHSITLHEPERLADDLAVWLEGGAH
jgi:hypothetical protein